MSLFEIEIFGGASQSMDSVIKHNEQSAALDKVFNGLERSWEPASGETLTKAEVVAFVGDDESTLAKFNFARGGDVLHKRGANGDSMYELRKAEARRQLDAKVKLSGSVAGAMTAMAEQFKDIADAEERGVIAKCIASLDLTLFLDVMASLFRRSCEVL